MHEKLSEKYVAGFLDADGSIQVPWRPATRQDDGLYRAYLSLEFCQLTWRDDVLKQIQGMFGGVFTASNDSHNPRTDLKIFGKRALIALNRIEKYLVVKRRYASAVREVIGKVGSAEERQNLKAWLKEQRRKDGVIPNYPSAKWMAGFFDGDGCFYASLPKNRTSAQLTASVTGSSYDKNGILLLHKAYGGSVREFTNGHSDLIKWTLRMPASKIKEFVGRMRPHMVVKRQQADYLMRLAEIGHFRNGREIHAEMKRLKAQPHRLNDSDVAQAA